MYAPNEMHLDKHCGQPFYSPLHFLKYNKLNSEFTLGKLDLWTKRGGGANVT